MTTVMNLRLQPKKKYSLGRTMLGIAVQDGPFYNWSPDTNFKKRKR
jgi:hypothetical protein